VSFASPIFLWYFLPATLVLTWLVPNRGRNAVIALASLVFYVVGAGALVILLLVLIGVNYLAGRALEQIESPDRRRLVLIGAVTIDIGSLVVWKYADFGSRQLDHLSRSVGLGGTSILRLALPIGISFYVFHQVSYVVDIYRRVRPPQRGLLSFTTYVCMFPQLIAGPIVRYHEIADQLAQRTTGRWDDLADGFPRFCLGLTKKVVIADSVGPIADAVFAVPGSHLDTRTAWIGVIAYTVQIYFDFSGYSDMAIGLGRMMGFQLPENFDRPYSAHSITDFWRRWHLSLSRWFKDYVYIPLGGNRGGTARTYRNLVLVFLLVGFWHGANWTFVVWGGYHGSLLVIERIFGVAPRARGLPQVIARRTVVMLLVAVGWVFFRAPSLQDAGAILGRMFWWQGGSIAALIPGVITHQRWATLVVGVCVVLIPSSFVMGRFVQFSPRPGAEIARIGYLTVGLAYSTLLVAAGTFSPFLYYRF
jgi:alginate O-acetyltransferase complex protein AlgI